MTYEKHTTHTDALDTLGTIITDREKRDAIHLAVYPVEAGTNLDPGDHVYLDGHNYARDAALDDMWDDAVGIVDPFLQECVTTGEWFWLVVYPRQISSLRHVWEHSMFPPSGETGVTESADRQADEAWLRTYIHDKELPYGFDAIVEAVRTGEWGSREEYESITVTDDRFTFYGRDAYGEITSEFWDRMERYLGTTILNRPDYFSCTC